MARVHGAEMKRRSSHELSGLEAFGLANMMAPGSYRVSLISLAGGEVESSTGVKVISQAPVADAMDTLLVVGDAGMPERTFSPQTIDFIRAGAAAARRTGSVLSLIHISEPTRPY